jgi:adenylate kinase
MGPPGAGKGTQAELIVKEYGVCHISTGDMFREAIKNQTEMGKLAASYIEKGLLVPDSVTVGIVKDRLSQEDCSQKGFLLDGFPRNLEQAHALDQILSELNYDLTGVINIVVDKKSLTDRIVGRQICRTCGASYHVVLKRSKVEGVCDRCGSELYTRPDDTEEVLSSRLNVYEAQTAPLLEYYNQKGLVLNIDGNKALNDVFAEIKRCLD